MPEAPAIREAVSGSPDPRLRGSVESYTGYVELATRPMRRLEVPFAGIPMILSLGPSILVDGVRHRSFVAGLDDRATVTRVRGRAARAAGQPHAARRAPPARAADARARTKGRRDRGPTRLRAARRAPSGSSSAERLVERLQDAADWETRFALLDAFMLRRLAGAA